MAIIDRSIEPAAAPYPFQATPGSGPAPVPPPLRLGRLASETRRPDAAPSMEVVVYGLLQAGDNTAAWRDLAARALERNVCYEPDFALAAARHLREAPRPAFVFVWDARRPQGDPGALLGVFPVAMPTLSFGTLELFGWRHEQAVLGCPLVDRERAGEVIEHFFAWLADAAPVAGGIMLPMMPEDGPTAAVLRDFAERTGRVIRCFGAHERAVLRHGEGAEALLARALPGRRLKEIRRLRRRLAEKGEVAFTSAVSHADIRQAAEIFMEVEEAGWKGREGSAFLHTASGASFLRAATRSLSKNGDCRIDMLTLNGVPIATGIVLGGGGRALYWKTAFDERYGAYSPGVLLTLEMTARQLGDASVALTDSCAVADHPMINHLWPDRAAFADWFIPASPTRNTAGLALAREAASRSIRKTAKVIYRSIRPGR